MYVKTMENTVKNKPLVRFTIGSVTKFGFDCLKRAIKQIQKLYPCDITVCFNCDKKHVKYLKKELNVFLFDQSVHLNDDLTPMGVAWKLYPPRLDINRHEIIIDNDIILESTIDEIDDFLSCDDHCLMLQGISRTYGRFEKHVPANLMINSGLFGLPPGFDFATYVKNHAGNNWEENATGIHSESVTFDEQGLVALILSNQKHFLIPNTTITNCERKLMRGKGMHFIGLNRWKRHEPYSEWLMSQQKFHL